MSDEIEQLRAERDALAKVLRTMVFNDYGSDSYLGCPYCEDNMHERDQALAPLTGEQAGAGDGSRS